MQRNQPHSCSNCWFNGLQHGSVGLSAGYCVEHRVVLRQSDETTCGRHVRKDLLLSSALAQHRHHEARFPRKDVVQLIETALPVEDGVHTESETDFVRQDQIGDAVADYGELGSKVESLAILSSICTLRGDLALFSLGRSYTHRCVDRGGRWTSGIHMLMWARRRLLDFPKPRVETADLRYQTAVQLHRQVELAQWGVVMLRLLFVSDVGQHANVQGDDVGALADLAEKAAEETGDLSLHLLLAWVRNRGVPLIDAALPRHRYGELARALHREREREDEDSAEPDES
jgi:hypothetical protein